MDERAVKEYLIETDSDFRELVDRHQEFERRLAELNEKPFLTTEEEIEEVVVKKKKLALKDQMQVLINRHQSQDAIS